VPCVGRCQHAPVAVVGQNPIDEATPINVLTAVEKKEITAPITDYISHDDYIAGNGYQTLKGVLDGSIEAESIIKKMEIPYCAPE
jgi:formate dehydrogenase